MKGIRSFIHNKVSQRIHIHLIIILVIITNNLASHGTHSYCHISPCIHYTVIDKGRTGVVDATTVLPCSCFFPCFLCLRTLLHYFYSCFSLNTSTCIPIQLYNTNIHLIIKRKQAMFRKPRYTIEKGYKRLYPKLEVIRCKKNILHVIMSV